MSRSLDVMVNNASAKIVPEVTMDDWFGNLEVDLLGAMYGVRHAIDAMRKSKRGGAIVNIGSTSSLGYGPPHSSLPGYDAAKAAIMHLSASLEPLAKSDKIRVNCVVPDWIASRDVLEGIKDLTPVERRAWRVPRFLTTPDEIADAVYRLATDKKLAGRILVWWSGKKPRFIPPADRGYTRLVAS
jgi:NAD(P)-dependent dehydrogenase (short-subunit alcohol dehydrogenase family)